MDEVNALQSNRNNIKTKQLFRINVTLRLRTGGDDACGIYICLEVLMKYENIKIAFFVSRILLLTSIVI